MSLGTIVATILASALAASDPTVAAIIANGLATDDDQFAEQVAVPPLREPVVDVPFGDGNATGPAALTDAFYTYKDGTLSLVVSFNRQSNVLDSPLASEPLRYWSEAQVFSSVKPIGKFVGRNAFGTSATVRRLQLATIAVRFGRSTEPRDIRKTLQFSLPPAEAKALAAAAMVEFEFASTDQLSGPSKCTYLRSDATVDDPEEVSHLKCLVSAEVRSIRIVDRRTHETLAELYDGKSPA